MAKAAAVVAPVPVPVPVPQRLPVQWMALLAIVVVYGVTSLSDVARMSALDVRVATPVIMLDGGPPTPANATASWKRRQRRLKLRGLHWLAERAPDPEEGTRVERAPFDDPAVEDGGAEQFLPFQADLVDPMAGKERLVYDVNLVRMQDQLGLIDDGMSEQELEEVFQTVVDIFAKANVYIRFNRQHLRKVHKLTQRKTMAYLAYVEGPDLFEQLNPTPARTNYVEWFQREMRASFPVSSVEQLIRGPKTQLAMPGGNEAKAAMHAALLDWVVGHPTHLTPWETMHTTTLFPVYFFHHAEGAEASGARIVGRTGSCHAPRPIAEGTNVTCKRFGAMNGHDRLALTPQVAARTWAHELGHSLMMQHPRNSCVPYNKWEDGFLMQPAALVGQAGAGCPPQLTANQMRATAFSRRQIDLLRDHVRSRDVRQSPTLPGATTVGLSTEQVGESSVSALFERFLSSGRNDLTGAGKRAVEQFEACRLAPRVIVFSDLAAPRSGRVMRVRWMPSAFPEDRASRYVLLALDGNDFHVAQQSAPLTVPSWGGRQRRHVELDLPSPLALREGQVLALAALDGQAVAVDRKVFASDNVLYADVVGKLTRPATNILEPLMHLDRTKTTYPRVASAPVRAGTFLYSLEPFALGATRIALMPSPVTCAHHIFNFDLA